MAGTGVLDLSCANEAVKEGPGKNKAHEPPEEVADPQVSDG